MSSKFPFGPDGPYSEFLRRQREQADMFKDILGPATELQRRLEEIQRSLAHLRTLEDTGILATARSISGNGLAKALAAYDARPRLALPVLRTYATPDWMASLQNTARAIGRQEQGILAAQKQLGSHWGAS